MTNTSFFDNLAERWDAMETPDIGRRVQRVVALSDIRPGLRVLDVGCGTGVLIAPLLEAAGGNITIVALDPSEGMLGVARRKHGHAGIRFVPAGLENSGLESEGFDRVICNAVLPHFEDHKAALSEAYRLLAPGGLLVISHPIGRDAVNRIHGESGPAVSSDKVPPATELGDTLKGMGWRDVEAWDEADFYLVRCRRP